MSQGHAGQAGQAKWSGEQSRQTTGRKVSSRRHLPPGRWPASGADKPREQDLPIPGRRCRLADFAALFPKLLFGIADTGCRIWRRQWTKTQAPVAPAVHRKGSPQGQKRVKYRALKGSIFRALRGSTIRAPVTLRRGCRKNRATAPGRAWSAHGLAAARAARDRRPLGKRPRELCQTAAGQLVFCQPCLVRRVLDLGTAWGETGRSQCSQKSLLQPGDCGLWLSDLSP